MKTDEAGLDAMAVVTAVFLAAAGACGATLGLAFAVLFWQDLYAAETWACALGFCLLFQWRAGAALPVPRETGDAGMMRPETVTVLAVLGSGGHTTEMFYDLATLGGGAAANVALHYAIADTDKGSRAKAEEFERSKAGTRAGLAESRVHLLPRAREVGQSYFTSVFTTLRSTVTAVLVVFSVCPDLIVCNGPGTCVPIAAAAYALRFFGLKRVYLVYSESMACVSHLSLSGKILYHFVDRFTVQWEGLAKTLQRAEHAGRCVPGLPVLSEDQLQGDGTAIITVGSTKFDDLIKSADSEEFIDALKARGIRKLVVQKGNGAYTPAVLAAAGDFASVIEYSKDIPAMLRKASLVISHAGAGTVLDCLLHKRRMVIVPNETLMANHQVQLAEELAKYDLISWCRAPDVLSTLKKSPSQLRSFPLTPPSNFRKCATDLLGL